MDAECHAPGLLLQREASPAPGIDAYLGRPAVNDGILD